MMGLLVAAILILVGAMWGHGAEGHEVVAVQQRERKQELVADGLDLNLNLNLDPLNLVGLTDMCGKADYPSLCRSVVKGVTRPSVAIESAIRQLMAQTKRAKRKAKKKRNSLEEMEVCYENYDDAYTNLESCIENLKGGDQASLNINLSAALTDYVTCDDAISQGALSSPLTQINLRLRQMASNSLYLSSFLRSH